MWLALLAGLVATTDRELAAVAAAHPGLTLAVWVGEPGRPALVRGPTGPLPTASAIKAFYLVELFAAHASKLDEPLGADAVLADDAHPAISHFSAAQRADIRRELTGASVRRVGAVMCGTAPASNPVYNAAANLVTAALGGPERLTALIRKRSPAFAGVSARRYMLRDRKSPGDNEAPAAALAALHSQLATGTVPGLDAATTAAVRAALRHGPGHFAKHGALASDPATEVRAGWRETAGGPVVYVVMAVRPGAGTRGLDAAATALARRLVGGQ